MLATLNLKASDSRAALKADTYENSMVGEKLVQVKADGINWAPEN